MTSAAHSPTDLVDPLCGVVRAIVEPALPDGAPPGFRSRVAIVSDTRRFARWLADRVGGGTSWDDDRQARTAALGEAVERYCGNHIPDDLLQASSAEFSAQGVRHIRPLQLPAFSAAQLARPDFPYRSWDTDTAVRWLPATSDDGARCWLPASHVLLNWHSGPRRTEPRVTHLQYSGIATGTSLADASDRAVGEIIERDALIAWWTLGLPAVPIDPRAVPGLSEQFTGSSLTVQLVALPSEFGLPVIAACLREERHGIIVMGLAASIDPVAAAFKAAGEAVQVWTSARGLLEPDGTAFAAVSQGIFSPKVFLAHRADRRYLDAAGPQFENIRDLAAQVQLWLDPRMHPLAARFDPPGPHRPPEEAAQVAVADAAAAVAPGIPAHPVRSTAELRSRLIASGRMPVTANLTTSDVAEVGWRVARVIVPGMLTNAPAAFSYLGTPRLSEIAARHDISPASFTLAPPPHN